MQISDQGAVRPKVAPGVVDLGVACGVWTGWHKVCQTWCQWRENMPELLVHVVSGLKDKGCHFGGTQQELKPRMGKKRSWRKV